MSRASIALSGPQRLAIATAASQAGTDEATLAASVRAKLITIGGHRNRRPSNSELNTALDEALAET